MSIPSNLLHLDYSQLTNNYLLFPCLFIDRLPEDDLMFANDSQEEDAMIRQVGKYLKCISFHLYPMVLNLHVYLYIYLSQIKCKSLIFAL